MIHRINIGIILLLVSVCSHAQTASWATPPTYDLLEEYGDLYKVREHGKIGLAEASGKLLVPAVYDSITPFNEHLALLLEYEAGKYQIKGIINQYNYSVATVTGKLYIVEKYSFFSEGKLAVSDGHSKYGYLLPDGSLFKECQYLGADPFYDGLARIKKEERKYAYLQSNGNELKTDMEREGYTLRSVTSFNEQGEAYVQGEMKGAGIKRHIINQQGRFLREAKLKGKIPKNYNFRKTFTAPTLGHRDAPSGAVQTFKEGEVYGYLSNNGNVLLPAQFSEVHPFQGGYARVKMNGKYGVLQLHSGSFTGKLDKSQVTVKGKRVESVRYSVSIPSEYLDKPIMMKGGDSGEMSVETNLNVTDGIGTYTFTPAPRNEESEISYQFALWADGLLLWKDTQSVALQYIKYYPPTLSIPQTTGNFSVDSEGYVRADSDNKVDVYAVISNHSPETLYITVSIEGNGVKSVVKELSIAPEGSERIATCIDSIRERKPVEVVVKTSTGLKQSNIIKVKPFI